MRIKADLTLLVISIIWGTAFVSQRVAGGLGAVYTFNGVRYVLAGLVVLPFAWRGSQNGGKIYNNPKDQIFLMGSAGILLFIASIFQQAGMRFTTAGNAGFLTSLYMVLVPIVLFIGWHERLTYLSLGAILLASFGAYLLSSSGQFQFQKGDVLELIGALFWAMHVVLLGKLASRYDFLSFSVGQLLVCGILNLLIGLFIPEPSFSWTLFGAALYTAVFSLGLCYTLQVWAQRHTPPTDAALILSLESVFAAISGTFLLGEYLTPIQICGCFFIIMAVILSQSNAFHFRVK